MKIGFDDKQAGHLCALDHLNGIKNAHERQITRKVNVRPHFLRRTVAISSKIGTPGTPYRFEARSDRYTWIEQLCLLQTVVCEVKIFAGDIEAYQCEALFRCFVQVLLLDADVAHLFT